MIENVSLWVSESHQLSRTWQQNPSAAGSCVASYPRREADPSDFQMFPSWWSPPSRIQTTSCKHQILKRTSSEWVWLLNYTAKQLQRLNYRRTFPEMFCTAVSQDGDKWLFISAKLLLSCLEEGLWAQAQMVKHHTFFIPQNQKSKQTTVLKRGTPPVLHVSG